MREAIAAAVAALISVTMSAYVHDATELPRMAGVGMMVSNKAGQGHACKAGEVTIEPAAGDFAGGQQQGPVLQHGS